MQVGTSIYMDYNVRFGGHILETSNTSSIIFVLLFERGNGNPVNVLPLELNPTTTLKTLVPPM